MTQKEFQAIRTFSQRVLDSLSEAGKTSVGRNELKEIMGNLLLEMVERELQ